MKKQLLVAALFAVSTTAMAATTEVLHQANGGKVDTTAQYVTGSLGGIDGVTSTKSTLNLKVGYGLTETDQLSFNVDTGTDTTEVASVESKETGMGDLTFGYQGNNGMIYYGGDLAYSGTSNGEDRKTGGMTITPFIAAMTPAAAWNVGGKLSYALKMDRKTDISGTETTTQGGNALTIAAFAETNYGPGWFTAGISMTPNVQTKTKDVAGSEVDQGSIMGLNVGGTYNFTETATGLATIAMDSVSNSDLDAADGKFTTTAIQLGGRFTF